MDIIKPEYIKKADIVGRSFDGHPIYYVLTKGGYHVFAKKKKDKYVVLGTGARKGLAYVAANSFEKNISWNHGLFKSAAKSSDELMDISAEKEIKSTPEAHKEQAIYYAFESKTAKDGFAKIYNILRSLSHLQAAGVKKADLLKSYNKIMSKLAKNVKNGIMEIPYDEELLVKSFEETNKKTFKYLTLSDIIL